MSYMLGGGQKNIAQVFRPEAFDSALQHVSPSNASANLADRALTVREIGVCPTSIM